MLSPVWLFLSITFSSTVVLACEGECIVNVTKFILRSYSNPVYDVFQAIAGEIEASIIPPSSRTANRLDYITPLLSSYEGTSYSRMETAIFPSYFHGKCEDPMTGVAPAGCPNPSCRVVCGTPGSMVYHFPKLRRIAFDTVHTMLLENTREGSDTYNAVRRSVKRFAAAQASPKLTTRSIPSIFWARKDLDLLLPEYKYMYLMKRADDIGDKLKPILESIPERLARACGYVGPDMDGSVDELQGCSWEAETVAYILRFP
ncbi:hypothetical protein BDM02DRAFT_2942688 [Thelephora ganbajun]|uniref:Uncharacterized protein n=1 Tax=Thelephora ganbajun TaxID=370292 RepID=A0ACB6ZT82_THEGA|nr:hypothetical protein BDM02DRAFT_2942688 [Thelephora ganbajun]